MIRRFVLIAAVALSLGGCVQDIKQDRTKVALVNAGVDEPTAGCMSHRMAQKLSIPQLRRLEALGGPKQGWIDYVAAVRRVHDNDALEVLLSSLALCKTGAIH